MTIEEFWNQAFLAALTRLPPMDARKDADEATEICISRWQDEAYNWAPQYLTRWKDQRIGGVPRINKPAIGD